jgi:hypothetical protein
MLLMRGEGGCRMWLGCRVWLRRSRGLLRRRNRHSRLLLSSNSSSRLARARKALRRRTEVRGSRALGLARAIRGLVLRCIEGMDTPMALVQRHLLLHLP